MPKQSILDREPHRVPAHLALYDQKMRERIRAEERAKLRPPAIVRAMEYTESLLWVSIAAFAAFSFFVTILTMVGIG